MNDIFREVDEEYRHEQLLKFWHENAKVIILALVLAIVGASGAGYWKSRQVAQQQNQTYTLAHAVGSSSLTELNKAQGEMTGRRAIAARFATAKATLDGGDKAGAIKLYDGIAGDSAATSVERSLADISSIGLQIDDGDPAALSQRLDKQADEKSAFRFSARELQVLLAMRQGDMQKAHDIAAALIKDTKAPDGVHNRAAQLASLSGEGLAPSPGDAPQAEPTVELPQAR